jgi:formylglycine-generating enzyme required for sulfatase activity
VIWKAIGRHRRPVAASALGLALLVCAVVSAWRVRVQAARIDMAKSERIEVMFGYDPAGALTEFSLAHNTVVGLVAEQASRDVASPSFARRIVGARSAAWTNQEAFWESVGANDANSLWRNGEWLELAEVDWPEPVALIDQLKRKAAGGTDKEKYVAFCLIGQLAVADPTVAELCKQAAREESNTGVAAAAWWAARQLDPNVPFPSSQVIQRDDVSGLAFVKIPACKAFRRGSPPTEKDRYEDEAMQQGKPIPTFYLSMTEVTARAFGQFWDDQRTDEWVESKGRGDRARTEVMNELCNQMKRIGSDEAVAWVSLEIAHQFCEWLTAAAKNRNMTPSRRYCVPSEDQWEYACRAGNPGRFCFGNNATYATYFANCGGYNPNALVAQRMPNFYGLFDMHGGLWEWCRTPYPADLVEDPGISPEQKENLYVFRGGAYYSPAIRCRSAQRNRGEPHGADGYRGFRIVMEYLSK